MFDKEKLLIVCPCKWNDIKNVGASPPSWEAGLELWSWNSNDRGYFVFSPWENSLTNVQMTCSGIYLLPNLSHCFSC